MGKFLDDFSEKWYFLGTIVGVFAGIAIGWITSMLICCF